MKILDIIKEGDIADVAKRSGNYDAGYYTVGDTHARGVGSAEPWDNQMSWPGASSGDENFSNDIATYIPKGSVVVISLGANDVVKPPKGSKELDAPDVIASRIKQVIDASNSRKNKTIFLLFPTGPKDNKWYKRRIEVRTAIEKAIGDSASFKYDLNDAPMQSDGIHATYVTYKNIADVVVDKFPLAGFGAKTSDKPEDKTADKKDNKPTTNTTPAPTQSVSNPGSGVPLKGTLIVNSPYGVRNGKPHYGVDLKAASGTPLLSPIDGKIMKAGEEGACGGSITVLSADGKEQHRFCHIKKFNVSVGQEVKAGDVIGLTGGAKGDPMAGNATGPNLHWEKKINGSLVDPMKGSMTPGQGGRMTPSSVQSKSATISSSSVSDYLKSKGMDDIHRIAILANIQGESSFEPGVLRTDRNGLPSGGLFQHNGPRYDAMTKAVPDWQTNWQGQVDYALGEPAGQKFLNTNYKTVNDAIADWLDKFEITADPIGDLSKREKFASQFA